MAQMKYKPAESDQLDLAIEACVPLLASKLKDVGIRDFNELYHFGVQVEANLNESIHEYSLSVVGVMPLNDILLLHSPFVLIRV